MESQYLNSKVNNLYDFIQKNNDANHSINTFSNETNMISQIKIFFIMIVFLFLGFTIYNYLDRNGYFDDKVENKTLKQKMLNIIMNIFNFIQH